MPARPHRFRSLLRRLRVLPSRPVHLGASWALAFAAASTALVACGGTTEGAPVHHPESALPPSGPVVRISDAEFAGAVHDLLVAAPGSTDRARLLAGVEGRQMDRAAERFRSHESGRGLVAVIGGLYLLRTGELDRGTLGPSSRDALREAVRELALHGDEGRARALYDILLRLGPTPPDQATADIQAHLDAIASWTHDELKAGPAMIANGSVESASVARSLLEPTPSAKGDAQKATVDWIAAAIDLQNKFREKKVRPSREEVGEAVRALHSGNDVLAEIYLRDADFGGALRALAGSPSKEAIRPDLQRALDALGPKATATQWLEVLHALTPSPREREQEEDEVMEDRELVRAATFGIALEAYRLDPSQPEAAALVAAVLQDLGLAEASPTVIVDATRAHPDARTVSGALTIVVRAMSLELEANDFDAVRRTYAAAAPILAIAERKEIAADLQPNAAKVRAMMGEIELEQGGVDTARALLSASAAEEKSASVLLSLARIDRHDGQVKAALEDVRAARDAADTAKDPALHGEVLLLMSDLTRELGDAPGARAPLTDALTVLMKSRTQGSADERARVEQVLARVLDRFGAKDKAQQALERAFEATPHDKRQIAATLGQVVARAFIRKDLRAAHDGLTRAIASEVADDELVYYALWVHLLEKQLKKPTDAAHDPITARVFASIPDDGHWVGKLAAFGAGKIPASQLLGLAKTKAERTEATFYQVMDSRTSGVVDPDNAGLRSVLHGDGVDLMELVIAREILRDAAGEAPLSLPPGVKLP
jgi:tetratricopeptide (TPR) repeat protein